MQSLDDLLPQLLVDDVHQTTARDYQVVQFVQVQHGFGHYRKAIDGSAWNEGETRKLGLVSSSGISIEDEWQNKAKYIWW